MGGALLDSSYSRAVARLSLLGGTEGAAGRKGSISKVVAARVGWVPLVRAPGVL